MGFNVWAILRLRVTDVSLTYRFRTTARTHLLKADNKKTHKLATVANLWVQAQLGRT